MPVLLYIAVAFVALFGVMLEMHALVEPTRHIERAALTESQPAPAVAPPRASGQALPPYATKAGINPPGAVEKALAPKPEAAPAAQNCHVEACKAAYRSFTASDCTYQPYEGPRRLCTK
jgi:BA14K-like protein